MHSSGGDAHGEAIVFASRLDRTWKNDRALKKLLARPKNKLPWVRTSLRRHVQNHSGLLPVRAKVLPIGIEVVDDGGGSAEPLVQLQRCCRSG
jgi:hypothetical protein